MMPIDLRTSRSAVIPYLGDSANDLATDEERGLIEHMAGVMAALIEQTGHCSTRMLIVRGFAQDDVFRLWLPVSSLADEKMLFREDSEGK